MTPTVTPVGSVPEGKVTDFLTGKLVTVSPLNEYAAEYGAGPSAFLIATVEGSPEEPEELRPDPPVLQQLTLTGRGRVLAARWTPATTGGSVQDYEVQLVVPPAAPRPIGPPSAPAS